MIKKNSYELRVYESVDDNSLFKAISQKTDEKNKSCNKGLINLFYRNYDTNIVLAQLLTIKIIGIRSLTIDDPVDNTKSLTKYLPTYYSSLCP